MVRQDLRLSRILGRPAFENAIRVNAAIGGSTNFVVHLLALAGRAGVELSLDDFDRLGSHLPLLVDLMPSGRFLMEDFYYAGGLPVVIRELEGLLHMDALTVNGRTLADNTAGAPCHDREVIRPFGEPVQEEAGIAVLRGNLAEEGAIIKPSAATPELLQHRGRAVVFEDIEDLQARIDDADLEVDESCVLVLKGAGPKGYPGMAEVGNLPMPKKLVEAGVRDMVRISDGRMSGTAYGTVVLHTSPESAVGGDPGPGAQRRRDRVGRARPRPAPARRRRGAEQAPWRLDPAAAPRHAGLRPPLRGARAAGAPGGGLRLPARRVGGRGSGGRAH